MSNKNLFQDNQQNQEKEYSFNEFYFLLKKHFKIILSIIFLGFILTVYNIYSTIPVYSSYGTIIVSKEQSSMSMLDVSMGSERNFIDNEIEILKSRSTSEMVVKKLLNSEYKNNLFLFGTKIATSPINRYLNIENNENIKNNKQVINDIDHSIINNFAVKLQGQISISNDRKTDAIKIAVTSPGAREASLLVNTLIDVYKTRDLEWVTGEMNHLKVFLINQLTQKKIELNQSEDRLREFQKSEKIFGLDESSKILLDNLTKVETDYNNTLASISIIDEKQKYLNDQLTKDEIELSKRISNTINERLLALKNEMALLEIELVSIITKYGDGHSAVEDLNAKISILKARIHNETNELILNGVSIADPISYRQSLMDSSIYILSKKATLLSKANAYKSLVNDYEDKLSMLPEKILEYSRLERVKSIHAETYSFMSKKLEEAKIGEASKLSKIRVIDNAIPGWKAVKPDKKQILFLGLLLSLIIGVSVAMLYEMLDYTIKSIEQIERRNLNILAIIPSMSNPDKKINKSKRYMRTNIQVEKLKRRLITHEDPKSPISEAYRSLRTSLMYVKNKEECNFILVSSPGPGEGKTTNIANLAITYANLGKKTILIDSDLRKPVVHKVFNKSKTPGLTSYLSSNSDLSDIIVSTEVENLDIVTSGIIPPNPSELLDSQRMNDFVSDLKKNYEVVLFDSPPLIAVTDAYVLLKHINQFILVVRPGVTQKGALDRILSTAKHSEIKINGVIVNAMSQDHSYGAGYYYNYYQYYYGSDES